MNKRCIGEATLYGLGVGPGDPELLTLKALRVLKSVPVLAYPAPVEGTSFARSIADSLIPKGKIEIAIRMPLDMAKFPAEDIYTQASNEIIGHLDEGRDVAVLCEGDPFFYGSFIYLFERISTTHKTEVVPGVSSVMACAAALEAPIAARNDIIKIIPAPLSEAKLSECLNFCDSAVIIKVGRHMNKVCRVLNDLQLYQYAKYIERATLPNERILPLSKAPDPAPYFSMILMHRRGDAWK